MEQTETIKTRIGFGGKVVPAARGQFTFIVQADSEGIIWEVAPPKGGWPLFPNADTALNILRRLIPKYVAGTAGEYMLIPYFEEPK
jgi:hypothetical protein